MNRSTRGSAPTEHGTNRTHASTHAPKSQGGSPKKQQTGSCSDTHASSSNLSTQTCHDETLPRLRHTRQRKPLPTTRRTKKGDPPTLTKHSACKQRGPLQIRGGTPKGGEGRPCQRHSLLALRNRTTTRRPVASRPHSTGGPSNGRGTPRTRTPLLQHPTTTPHRQGMGPPAHRRTPPTPPQRTQQPTGTGGGGRGTHPTPVTDCPKEPEMTPRLSLEHTPILGGLRGGFL